MPRVSIVIPAYNAARDLTRALSSIRDQTFGDWEVVIVDNHSADDTEERVRQFQDPRIRLFKIHNEGVIARSRNMGIDHATGEYVAFLDADDWWTPRKLARSLHYLDRGADVVYHDLFLATKPGQKIFLRRAKTWNLNRPVYADLISGGNALNNSSVVVRRSLLTDVEGLSERPQFVAFEDYDLWLRVARRTDRFVRIPETLGYYWKGGGNTSGPARTLESIAVIKEHYATALAEFGAGRNIYWLDYAAARSYFRLGRYAEARASLEAISRERVPVRVQAIMAWMQTAIQLFHRRS